VSKDGISNCFVRNDGYGRSDNECAFCLVGSKRLDRLKERILPVSRKTAKNTANGTLQGLMGIYDSKNDTEVEPK
jgi:hypothetical protein